MFARASKKVIAAALVAGTLATALAAGSTAAQAGWHHRHHWGRGAAWGVAGAALGLGLIGAAAAANAAPAAVYEDDVQYRRVCRSERQYDDYGAYLGRVRVCRTVAY